MYFFLALLHLQTTIVVSLQGTITTHNIDRIRSTHSPILSIAIITTEEAAGEIIDAGMLRQCADGLGRTVSAVLQQQGQLMKTEETDRNEEKTLVDRDREAE